MLEWDRPPLWLHPLFGLLGRPLAAVLERVVRLSGRRLGIVLVYHRVADANGQDHGTFTPCLGVHVFENQLRHILGRYSVVPAVDLRDAVRQRRRGERFPVAVTFDDDLTSHADITLTVLKQVGVHATFFVSGASLEQPFSFWWERLHRAVAVGADVGMISAAVRGHAAPVAHAADLQLEIELLSPADRDNVAALLLEIGGPDPPNAGIRAEQLRTLLASGMDIGFHTLRHDRLTSLASADLVRAMVSGRAALECVVGHPLTAIAYPHGQANSAVASAAEAAGFVTGFTVQQGPVLADSNPLLLGRLAPTQRSQGHFALQLAITLFRGRRKDERSPGDERQSSRFGGTLDHQKPADRMNRTRSGCGSE
jgi:peptidoglycan/xylan/chitin deacetylase (PgdA/CDA1 family)